MAATRRAEVTWEGDLMSGKGVVSARSSGLFSDAPVSWAARTEASDGKTSPEELLAAAHASCFSMAFSGRLAKNGTPGQKLEVSATVTFEKVETGFKVTKSELAVTGWV
jgi:osmotically inducible protein OsmC